MGRPHLAQWQTVQRSSVAFADRKRAIKDTAPMDALMQELHQSNSNTMGYRDVLIMITFVIDISVPIRIFSRLPTIFDCLGAPR